MRLARNVPNGRRPSRTTRVASARCISSMSRRPTKAAISISRGRRSNARPRSTDYCNVSLIPRGLQCNAALHSPDRCRRARCMPLSAGAQAWPTNRLPHVPFAGRHRRRRWTTIAQGHHRRWAAGGRRQQTRCGGRGRRDYSRQEARWLHSAGWHDQHACDQRQPLQGPGL